jgi:hypothetical protein
MSTAGAARYTGRCLCGGVRYAIAGDIGPAVFCHCSQCRRASGSAFAANASIRTADFSCTQGQDLIREFESSPGKLRAFCSACGSPLFARHPASPEVMRLRLGTLDQADDIEVRGHIWTGSGAGWYHIADALEQAPGSNPWIGQGRDVAGGRQDPGKLK